MIKTIQARIFPFIIALSALTVSASAAFYSVSGLSKLFAGAAFAVIIMAASLEVAKLVIASLLYQYRENLPRLLKYYLSVACFILILITSMGIYGFLSAAYQETAAKEGNIDSQIALIETKRDNIKEQLAIYNAEKESINEAVSSLRSGLSNNVIQYTDTLGNIITTTSSSTRQALEKQLDQAIGRQTEINTRVDGLNQQLFEYETEIVEVTSNANIAGELGPLKYLSGLKLTLKTKDNKEPEVKIVEKIVEVPVEVEKIVEKTVKLPSNLRGPLEEVIKHARRRGEKVPTNTSRFFD